MKSLYPDTLGEWTLRTLLERAEATDPVSGRLRTMTISLIGDRDFCRAGHILSTLKLRLENAIT
jgi:hypothetical protein